ncbi:MAG: nitronate monooxygenase [Dehalococcoidia bacterium]
MPLDKSNREPSEGFLKTRLTELLGIKYPIVQCGMVWVSTVPMVVAVCNAGGLGILTASEQTADELRRNIDKVRELTGNKPFGVNVAPAFPGYRTALEVVVKEKVPVLSHGLGNPFQALGGKPDGLIFMPTVGSAKQAIWMQKGGADAVIVHGHEGGGHPGFIGSTVLIPKTADSIKIPIVAAGGFCDGRGLIAALALGADGIGMGTRFAVSQESSVPQNIKEWWVRTNESEPTISYKYDGLHLRAIKGEKLKGYRGWWSRPWELISAQSQMRQGYKLSPREMMRVGLDMRKMGLPIFQMLAGYPMGRGTLVGGEEERGLLPSGQVAGRITDIPTCQEIIERIVAEAGQTMHSLGAKWNPRQANISTDEIKE